MPSCTPTRKAAAWTSMVVGLVVAAVLAASTGFFDSEMAKSAHESGRMRSGLQPANPGGRPSTLSSVPGLVPLGALSGGSVSEVFRSDTLASRAVGQASAEHLPVDGIPSTSTGTFDDPVLRSSTSAGHPQPEVDSEPRSTSPERVRTPLAGGTSSSVSASEPAIGHPSRSPGPAEFNTTLVLQSLPTRSSRAPVLHTGPGSGGLYPLLGARRNGQECCYLPRREIDSTDLSRFHLDKCAWWCPHGPNSASSFILQGVGKTTQRAQNEQASRPSEAHPRPSVTKDDEPLAFCYHASPKSGTTMTLFMLYELVEHVTAVLGYVHETRNFNHAMMGMRFEVNHTARSVVSTRVNDKHLLPQPDCNNIVTTRDIRDQLVSIWHYRNEKPSSSVHYCERYRNPGSVECGPTFMKYASYTREFLTYWPEYRGILLLNYPTIVEHKVQAMQYMLDYMGFDWRRDRHARRRVLDVMAALRRKFEMNKSRGIDSAGPRPATSAGNQDSKVMETVVHFRAGVARNGYLKELSPKAVEFLDSSTCQLFPILAAIWGVDHCDLDGPIEWWSPDPPTVPGTL